MIRKIKLSTFIEDVISLSAGRFIVVGLGFLAGILLARILGPNKQGIVTTLLVVPTLVISFADLGMRQAATYYLGKRIYDDQSIISTVLLMTLFTSLLSIVIVLVVYYFAGYPTLYGTFALILPFIYVPMQLFLQFGNGILMAKQRIRNIAIANALTEILYIILLIPLLLLKSYQVEFTLLAYTISSFFVVFYVAGIIKQYGKMRPAYIPGLPWQFLKLGVIYGIALFVLGLNYRVDVILLERLSNATEVGIYTIGVGIAEKLWLLPAALTTVNFARSAEATNAFEYARKTAKVLRIVLWIGIIPCLILYLVSPWVIPFIYGEAYKNSGFVVQAILPGVWASLIFKILNSDLAGRGRPEAALWVYGLALIINVVLNLWWIPAYGAMGSAWASSISYLLGAILFGVVYSKMSNISLFDLFIPRMIDFKLSFREQG